jgi:hypothetical protein
MMSRAGFLEGMPEHVDISGLWQLSAITDDAKAKAFEAKFGIPLMARFRHVPHSFGRMIAKIGYCQVLTTLDVGDFEPICLPYILGEKPNVSYVVGGYMTSPLPNEGLGYVLRTLVVGNAESVILIAEVRLYANAHTPTYHIVVGKVTDKEAVARVQQKLGEGVDAPLAPGNATPGAPWLPTRWPLS